MNGIDWREQLVRLDESDILCNDVILPQEFNPHNVRLWIIGHEFGPVVAIWAQCEQEALDEMLDKGYVTFLVEEPEDDVEYTYLGNASEACNLDYAWIVPCEFDIQKDFELLMRFAEARGAGRDVLWG